MVVGGLAVAAAWTAVATGRLGVWVAQISALVPLAGLAVWTGWVSAAQTVTIPVAAAAGVGGGIVLYLATAAFVLVVSRWEVFARHVQKIYELRGGLPVPLAALLAAGVTAVSEEIFWRGLFQARLTAALGPDTGAAVTWGAYVVANLPSASLPIAAGAIVGGAAWTALAWWTGGVLASALCHSVWTALMVVLPPGAGRSE